VQTAQSEQAGEEFVGTTEAAGTLHRHPSTVRRAAAAGALRAVRIGDRGHFLIARRELDLILGRGQGTAA
jgi:excisionase family DNA binding protein